MKTRQEIEDMADRYLDHITVLEGDAKYHEHGSRLYNFIREGELLLGVLRWVLEGNYGFTDEAMLDYSWKADELLTIQYKQQSTTLCFL